MPSYVFDVAGLLVLGSMSSLLRKLVFQLQAPGLNGDVHYFRKPTFTTFLAPAACLFVLLAAVCAHKGLQCWRWGETRLTSPRHPLLAVTHGMRSTFDSCKMGEEATSGGLRKWPSVTARDALALALPSTCFFTWVLLAGWGLLYIPASLAFILQSSCILFTAACSVILLKRKLNSLHVRGIAAALLGISLVAAAGVLDSEHATAPATLASPGSDLDGAPSSGWMQGPHMERKAPAPHHAYAAAFGIGLTLLSQLVQAMQFVSEEMLLPKCRLTPYQVMGMEGTIAMIWSCVALALFSVLPGGDTGGVAENLSDTLVQLRNDWPLALCCFGHFIGTAGLNTFGLRISLNLGSVFRAVLLSLRTLLVWAANLALFYGGVGDGNIGESWKPHSPLQLVGFLVLLLGTVLYSQGCSAVVRNSAAVTQALRRAGSAASTELRTWHAHSQHASLPDPAEVGLLAYEPSISSATSLTLRPDSSKAQTFGRPLRSSPRPTPPTSPGATAPGPSARLGAGQPLLSGAQLQPLQNEPDDISSVISMALSDSLLDSWRLHRSSMPQPALPAQLQSAAGCSSIDSRTGAHSASVPADGAQSLLEEAETSSAVTAPVMLTQQHPRALPPEVHPSHELVTSFVQGMRGLRGWDAATTEDVRRELLRRMRSGSRTGEPTVQGTFAAVSSWVHSTSAADPGQHRGASSFMNPFMAQVQRSVGDEELDELAGSLVGSLGPAPPAAPGLERAGSGQPSDLGTFGDAGQGDLMFGMESVGGEAACALDIADGMERNVMEVTLSPSFRDSVRAGFADPSD